MQIKNFFRAEASAKRPMTKWWCFRTGRTETDYYYLLHQAPFAITIDILIIIKLCTETGFIT